VDSPEINAFALPGGFAYVNRGLIEAAETQDELAGVFMKFSRQAEREADRLGARMLYDASLQPRGMVSFFEKLAALQKSQPNAVLKFFSAHPSPAERSSNVSTLIDGYATNSKVVADTPAFLDVKKQLAAMPRPEVEAAKAAAAIAAVARPPAEPEAEVRSRNMVRDRDIAPRFDYITNFDFDGDWRGALLSEAVMAHENDLEGALVGAEKNGEDYTKARLTLVETLAHNNYLKYVPPGSSLSGDPVMVEAVRPRLFIEPKGHGIEAWRDDPDQHRMAENAFMVYVYAGTAEDPEAKPDRSVGYDLLPTYESFWTHAGSGKNETFGEEHDYGVVSARFAQGEEDVLRHIRLGVMGSALNGVIGAANMSRPPWGWFDGLDRGRPLGEWFLQPAEIIRRHWKLPESFSTTYTYHPFLGQFR
jgi:hypothetical protein